MAWLDTLSRFAAAVVPRVWGRLPVADRTLFLTFDDGPSAATPGVLDVLEAQASHASFFVLGERLTSHPEICRRLRASGHTIGSHGWHHADPWRTWQPNRWRLGDGAVHAAFGFVPRWQRPPYGHLTPGLWRHSWHHHQHIALWDAMPGDFRPTRPVSTLVDACRKRARAGSILVLHDGETMHGRIEPLVERLVPALLADGWRLAALPDLPQPGGSG